MRSFEMVGIPLGDRSMYEAVSLVYGDDIIRSTHKNVQIGSWKDKMRHLEFVAALPHNLPKEIAPFFCGRSLRISVTQRVKRDNHVKHEVHNHVRLHIIGSELFCIKPRFIIRRNPNPFCARNAKTTLDAHVEVHAILPPPLCGIIENFMIKHATSDMINYTNVITNHVKKMTPFQIFVSTFRHHGHTSPHDDPTHLS